ncbi:MAG: hypothetical protein JWR42_1452 [Marmoricola sp.]|nr:hypothetical protein [Marmoricola sp.]
MTTSPALPTEPAEPGALADRVAAAALAVPGVSGLHAGSFGEVGTYLVGRQVRGVRLRPEGAEVHVTVDMGRPLLEVAEGVRSAVAPLVATEVTVVVEDVTPAASPGIGQV